MNINLTMIPMLLLGVCVLAMCMLWLASLVDCIQNETEQKALWLALLVVGGAIVGPIYWFVQRPARARAPSLARYGNTRSDLVQAMAQMQADTGSHAGKPSESSPSGRRPY